MSEIRRLVGSSTQLTEEELGPLLLRAHEERENLRTILRCSDDVMDVVEADVTNAAALLLDREGVPSVTDVRQELRKISRELRKASGRLEALPPSVLRRVRIEVDSDLLGDNLAGRPLAHQLQVLARASECVERKLVGRRLRGSTIREFLFMCHAIFEGHRPGESSSKRSARRKGLPEFSEAVYRIAKPDESWDSQHSLKEVLRDLGD